MKFTKLSLIAALTVSAITTSAMAADEINVSANMGITSKYIWRGMDQVASSPAFQSGIDVDYMGLYAGTWGSNVASGLEADVYGGYATELAGIGFDLGYIKYIYPKTTPSADFAEAYLGLSKDLGDFGLNAMYSKGLDAAKVDDWTVGATVALPMDSELAIAYGDYDTYGTRYSAGISKSFGKFDFDVTYSDFEADTSTGNAGMSDEDHIIASVGTSF
jgi:uncharacterized protein (TIGR02001 family)